MLKYLLLILVSLSLISCWKECETKECFDYKIAQEKLAIEKEQADKLYRLEEAKTRAIIENSKPTEVRIAEIQAEETTVWEWIVTAAWVAAASYVWIKALDYLFSD